MVDTTTSVNFFPTKRLLVDIITKDINVRDSILDLIDNSVDSYIRYGYKDQKDIRISIDNKTFYIEDACGGMSRGELMNHVFRTGDPPKILARTIGYYGIGLKRSLFKLAKEFELETFDGKEYSKVELEVEDWLSKPDDWTVPLSTNNGKFNRNTKPFTKIVIKKYREDISRILSTMYINELKERLSIYYSRFIEKKKIKFVFNEKPLEPFDLAITMSKEYDPANYLEKLDGIEIQITCWIEPKKSVRDLRVLGKQGWNVFMNDRLILIDDVSPNTGWSGKPELPKNHPIYNQFRGIVLINSNDPSKLPLNTTKNGFNLDNAVYREIKQKMISTARPLINYLSKKYDSDEVDNKENEISEEIFKDSLARGDLKKMSIDELKIRTSFKSPEAKPKSDLISIIIKKPKKIIDKLLKRYHKKTAKEIGEMIFDYFWNYEGLDDD